MFSNDTRTILAIVALGILAAWTPTLLQKGGDLVEWFDRKLERWFSSAEYARRQAEIRAYKRGPRHVKH